MFLKSCSFLSVFFPSCFSHPFCSGVRGPGGGRGGVGEVLSSRIPCRASLSWGKDDRKSARWHRAGLQHVTSSLEMQEAGRRGGRREEEEEGAGWGGLRNGGEEMEEGCDEWSWLSLSYITVSVCSTSKIRSFKIVIYGNLYCKSITVLFKWICTVLLYISEWSNAVIQHVASSWKRLLWLFWTSSVWSVFLGEVTDEQQVTK